MGGRSHLQRRRAAHGRWRAQHATQQLLTAHCSLLTLAAHPRRTQEASACEGHGLRGPAINPSSPHSISRPLEPTREEVVQLEADGARMLDPAHIPAGCKHLKAAEQRVEHATEQQPASEAAGNSTAASELRRQAGKRCLRGRQIQASSYRDQVSYRDQIETSSKPGLISAWPSKHGGMAARKHPPAPPRPQCRF